MALNRFQEALGPAVQDASPASSSPSGSDPGCNVALEPCGGAEMVVMPEAWKSILNSLVAAPIAWQSPGQIAVALGRDVEETTDLLSLMDEAGWIAVWDVDAGPFVTLSTLAADRLQVVVVEFGVDETPRWAHAGDPIPPLPKAKYVSRLEGHARQESVVDPAPSPDLAAERTERAERLLARAAAGRARRVPQYRAEDLPWPSLLLGLGLTPWPGPGESSRGNSCPACGNRPLLPHMYCLCCDRWGLDDRLAGLAAASPFARPRPSPPPLTPSSPTLSPPPFLMTVPSPQDRYAERRQLQEQIRRERARRKARRKARRASPREDKRP